MFVIPAGAGGPEACEGFEIKNSVSFSPLVYSNLNRLFGAATNRRKFTLATWVKRTLTNTTGYIFCVPISSSAGLSLVFNTAGTLAIRDGSTGVDLFLSTGLYRDQFAHYHIVVNVDTDNPVMSERIRVEVNGVRAPGTVNVGQVSLYWNNPGSTHYLGAARLTTGPGAPSAIILSETHFLDGVNVNASEFGFFCPSTGQWRPKRYTESNYGLNGFYLDYSDGSAATAAALGKDRSGNGNDFTPALLTVTGVISDWLTDTTSHNAATLGAVLLGGGMSGGTWVPFAGGGGIWYTARVSQGMRSGKWYMESTYGPLMSSLAAAGQMGPAYWALGIVRDTTPDSYVGYVGQVAESYGWLGSAQKYNNSANSAYGVAIAAVGDTIMMAYDADTGKLYMGRNGVWFNSSDPVAGLNPMYTVASNPDRYMFGISGSCTNNAYNTHQTNMGQRPFKYAPPTGFKGLSSKTAVTERVQPADAFQTVLGTGDVLQAAIDGSKVRGKGLKWVKNRDAAVNHVLTDAVRGPTLQSALTASAETAFVPYAGAANHVAWLFNKTPRDGVDIVLFDKTTSNQTIAHGLGKKPTMMIVKNRASGSWFVYVSAISQVGSVPANGAFLLDTLDAWNTSVNYWNNTEPTASDFTIGVALANGPCIAYLITDVPGLIATGMYAGTGVAGSPTVFTGFQPAFVLQKATIATADWSMYDTKRDPVNPVNRALFPMSASVESTATGFGDFISCGFVLRSTGYNVSGRNYFYLAIAEFAQKFANAR